MFVEIQQLFKNKIYLSSKLALMNVVCNNYIQIELLTRQTTPLERLEVITS